MDARDPEQEERERLANALDNRRRDIVERWLSAVRAEIDVSGVSSTELRDALPDYLRRLSDSLRKPERTLARAGSEAWREVAREHALMRVRLGFDIRELVSEFVLLRKILIDVGEEENLIGPSRQAVRLTDLLEAAISEAVNAYVEARDYAARQRQAQHIGFITHELANPLGAALLVSRQIETHPLLPAELRRASELLKSNLGRLEHLTQEILAAERFEADEVQPRPKAIALGDLFATALASAKLTADDKGIALTAVFEPSLEVFADVNLASSALENLLDNAVKYTDRGGVDLSVDETPEEILVHVRDTCGGIRAADLRTIFEPFQRGLSQKPGSGLGLAIARRAVEAQGGIIGVESTPGAGCHFWFTLAKPNATRDAALAYRA